VEISFLLIKNSPKKKRGDRKCEDSGEEWSAGETLLYLFFFK
jgi:hypothetical protein